MLIGQKYKTTIEEIFFYDKEFPPQKDKIQNTHYLKDLV